MSKKLNIVDGDNTRIPIVNSISNLWLELPEELCEKILREGADRFILTAQSTDTLNLLLALQEICDCEIGDRMLLVTNRWGRDHAGILVKLPK